MHCLLWSHTSHRMQILEQSILEFHLSLTGLRILYQEWKSRRVG